MYTEISEIREKNVSYSKYRSCWDHHKLVEMCKERCQQVLLQKDTQNTETFAN